VAGTVFAHDAGMGLVRYTAEGKLDTSFGRGGVVSERTPQGGLSPEALVVQADGKMVLVGTSSDLATTRVGFGLARYGVDGALDTSFGVGGRVLTSVGAATAEAHAAALQPDGAIVVAGSGYAGTQPAEVSQFAVARYTPDGALDPVFGVVLTPLSESGAEARAVALQSDGRIVVAGTAFASGTTSDALALARYNADGSPDTSFGSGGTVITTFDSGGAEADSSPARAAALVVQPDGKLVAVVSVGGHQGAFALARYLPSGALDSTFGIAGRSRPRPGDGSAQAYAAALQPDGGIVVAGGVGSTAENVAFALARYTPTGDLDAGFGSGGLVTSTFDGGGGSGAHAVVVERDGKIVAVGSGGGGFAVVQYLADGTPDAGFGKAGVVLTTVGDAGSMPAALGVQPDGKLVAAGLTYFLVPTPNSGGLLDIPLWFLVVPLAGLVLLAGMMRARLRRRAGSRTGQEPAASRPRR